MYKQRHLWTGSHDNSCVTGLHGEHLCSVIQTYTLSLFLLSSTQGGKAESHSSSPASPSVLPTTSSHPSQASPGKKELKIRKQHLTGPAANTSALLSGSYSWGGVGCRQHSRKPSVARFHCSCDVASALQTSFTITASEDGIFFLQTHTKATAV